MLKGRTYLVRLAAVLSVFGLECVVIAIVLVRWGRADLTAVSLEIFDTDGEFWTAAPDSSFVGSPVGCDANANTFIRAADVTCANALLFGRICAPGPDSRSGPGTENIYPLRASSHGGHGLDS